MVRPENGAVVGLQHLVLVAGHAVYLGRELVDPADDSNWALQPFQQGEPRFYIEHIRTGIDRAARDPGALLVFSGGQSRADAGPRSEAEGYRALADRFGWWSAPHVRARAATEEFARDSFENLLFGVCRFREVAGTYPSHVTIVSWAFKQDRFDRHRDALGFPASRVRFEGVNQPVDLAEAVAGERRTLAEFEKDPYGTAGRLAAKRLARDPFNRPPPYAGTCPEIVRLIEHRGPDRFRGALPWDNIG